MKKLTAIACFSLCYIVSTSISACTWFDDPVEKPVAKADADEALRVAAQEWLDANRHAGDEDALDLPPGSLLTAELADATASVDDSSREPPIPVHVVTRAMMLAHPTDIAKAVPQYPEYFLYPVKANGEIIGAVRLVRHDSTFEAVSFGEPVTTRTAIRGRRGGSTTPEADRSAILVVIPSASQQFIAVRTGSTLGAVMLRDTSSITLPIVTIDSVMAAYMPIVLLPDSVSR